MQTMETVGFERDLERWVDAGIIDLRQAEAIRQLEGSPRPAPPGRRVPLFAEVLGYVGAALAVVALWMSGVRTWESLDDWVRVALLVGLAGLLGGSGFLFEDATEPALARLRNALWAGAAAAAGGAAWFAAYDLMQWESEVATAVAGVVAAVVGALTLRTSRSTLQHLAMVIGAAVAISGAIFAALPDRGDTAATVLGIAFGLGGLGWLSLNRTERIPAREAGLVLGAAAMYLGASLLAAGSEIAALWTGLVAAGIVTAVGVIDEEKLLGWAGALGFLVWIPGIVFYYFGEQLGAVVGLLVVGVGFVGAAVVWTLRMRR